MRKLSPLCQWIYAILAISCLFSCTQKQVNTVIDSEEAPPQTYNAIPSEVLPPIKAEYIDASTLTPPIKVPLKGTPKVVPAHTNVKLAGTPKIIPIPKNVKSFTLGKDGVPLPKTAPAKINIMQKTVEEIFGLAGKTMLFVDLMEKTFTIVWLLLLM